MRSEQLPLDADIGLETVGLFSRKTTPIRTTSRSHRWEPRWQESIENAPATAVRTICW